MATPTAQPAARAGDFVQTIGINTHLIWPQMSYGNVDAVVQQIQYLGIDHIRDYAGQTTTSKATEKRLGDLGVKFDMLINANLTLAQNMAAIDAAAPYVDAVEGANEVTITPVTFNGLTGAAGAVALQKAVYAAVHADPLLNNAGRSTPVWNFTISLGNSYAPYGDVTPWADATTVHAYGGYGLPVQWFLQGEIDGTTDTHGLPVVITESGQNTLPGHSENETVQAKLLVDTLLDAFKAGVKLTYLYELEDDAPDPNNRSVEAHYGLFHNDGTPKLAAIAIHNLTSILADTGSAARSFTTAPLSYAMTGLPTTTGASSFVLEKSTGAYDIALWQEPRIWNGSAHTDIPITPSVVTLTLATTYHTINIYDPLASNTPVQTLHDVSSLQLSLGGGPLIIEVETAASEAAMAASLLAATATAAAVAAPPSNPAQFQSQNPDFSAAYYLAHNPDVAAAGMDPLAHYQDFGRYEGRNPDAFFNTRYYLNQNPDVAASGVDPLTHFETIGWKEGRDPSSSFSAQAYLQANADVASAKVDPLAHYLSFGASESRLAFIATPHATTSSDPLVDAGYYFAHNTDVASLGFDPGTHYNNFGWHEGRNPDALFDTAYYLAHNPDVQASGVDPLTHYEMDGWREGRNPSAAFSTTGYLSANADVRASGEDPLQHYLQHGAAEGRGLVHV